MTLNRFILAVLLLGLGWTSGFCAVSKPDVAPHIQKESDLCTDFLKAFGLSIKQFIKTPELSLQQIKEEHLRVDAYFERYESNDLNAMQELLMSIKKEEFKSLLGVDECCDCGCEFSRKDFPQRRKSYEDKVLEVFKDKLLHKLIKVESDNKKVLSLSYCEYAAGNLFQTFVLLNRLIRLINREVPDLNEIHLSLNLIDINSYKNKQCFKSLEGYLKNLKNVSLQGCSCRYDLVVCCDMVYNPYARTEDLCGAADCLTDHFRSLIRYLNRGGLFFDLNKYGEDPTSRVFTKIQIEEIVEQHKSRRASLSPFRAMDYDLFEKEARKGFFRRISGFTQNLRTTNPCLYVGVADEKFRSHEGVSVYNFEKDGRLNPQADVVDLIYSNVAW